MISKTAQSMRVLITGQTGRRINWQNFADSSLIANRANLKMSFEHTLIERHKMIRAFLGGTLCGVVMAAAVTFAVAIPANNIHWRAEIVKRGGGTWYFDKNGHWGWM